MRTLAQRLNLISERMERHGFKERLGECYQHAGTRLITDLEAQTLVHGSIHLLGDPVDHAWAILRSEQFSPQHERAGEFYDVVYDPTTSTTWYGDFEEVFGAVERVRYTREQALAMFLSVCHWGPFDHAARSNEYYHVKALADLEQLT